ncbi:hypothetical protein [Streptomyces sp. NBC_01014]|uniref:hypothetical protein n=1 Tax=Streptomyces sp. NBC_01014 TaxID=2903719 RepID=UPI00386812E3|nr:hypothetical protein OG282_20990 [Streptomyces sp. NBC_01014]
MPNQTVRSTPVARAAALCAAALISLGALSACSSGISEVKGEKSEKGVDSLADGASTSGSAAHGKGNTTPKDSTAGRPQLRLDTSPEEAQRLDDTYNACLQAHGVPMNIKRAALAGAKQAAPLQNPDPTKAHQAAYDACEIKLPLRPPETRPETNAHFADDYRAYVKCLQKRGMRIHMVPDTSVSPDGLSWRYDDSSGETLSDAEQTKADRDCMTEAFGGKG